MLAEQLGAAQLTAPQLGRDRRGQASAAIREHRDGTLDVHAALPAVISVTERAAEARFPNFKGIMAAQEEAAHRAVPGRARGIEASRSAHSVVLSTTERPAREAGTKIVDDGNAASRARRVPRRRAA